MHSVHHAHNYFRSYGFANKPLILFASFLFFWTLFDGMVSFFTPILITQKGFSVFTMGLIYSTSSIFGALFDILISKFFSNVTYKRFIYALLLLSFGFPLLLFNAYNAFLFIVAMAVWGIYYDLKMFGKFDFVAKKVGESERNSSFGLINVFEGLGYLIAPFIASFVLVLSISWYPLAFNYFFLSLASLLFFASLISLKGKGVKPSFTSKENKSRSFTKEFASWYKVFKKIKPLLILSLLLTILDAFYWTVGPLVIEHFNNVLLGSLFLTCYMLPGLFTGFLWAI